MPQPEQTGDMEGSTPRVRLTQSCSDRLPQSPMQVPKQASHLSEFNTLPVEYIAMRLPGLAYALQVWPPVLQWHTARHHECWQQVQSASKANGQVTTVLWRCIMKSPLRCCRTSTELCSHFTQDVCTLTMQQDSP